MNRRAFFALLTAPFVARLLPKKEEYNPDWSYLYPGILPVEIFCILEDKEGKADEFKKE